MIFFSREMKNQKGQATTAAMVLLPVILVVIVTLVILGFAFVFEAKATANCRASMIASQTEARDALEKLLALNPIARSLENERQAAIAWSDGSLKAGNPEGHAAAELLKVAIELKQKPVSTAQFRWLMKGRAASLAAAELAEAEVLKGLPTKITKQARLPDLTGAKFDVISEGPPGALTPTYRTAPGFEQSQRAEVRWLLTLPKTSNDETEFSPSINIGCAITLTNEGADKWSPQILEDKLLPN